MQDDIIIQSQAPLTDKDEDQLGFKKISECLAQAIMKNDLSKGLVIGVEGAWGSGKTTLVEFALEEIESASREREDWEVVRFQPWLIGRKEDLLGQFFAQLSSVKGIKNNKNLIKKYSTGLSGLVGFMAHAFENATISFSTGVLVRSLFKVAHELMKTSLTNTKKKLWRALSDNNSSKVVVFIDDLDRLDPDECVEVLRLVRSVADFPNIVYVITYDQSILAANIGAVLKIKDNGYGYMEKIIQVPYCIPKPLPYDLHNWFKDEAKKIVFSDFSNLDAKSLKHKWFDTVIDNWAPICIETPRDVVRTLHALKLYAVPVIENIDPGDMVFLQLIRIKLPLLYKWVENYVKDIMIAEGRTGLDSNEKGIAKQELIKISGNSKEERERILKALSSIFPKVSPDILEPSDTGFCDGAYESPSESNSRNKRLVSKKHFRFYFAFSMTKT